MGRSSDRVKVGLYIDPKLKRDLMRLRADTGIDMSDLAELALRVFFELIERGVVPEELSENVRRELMELIRRKAEAILATS